MVMGNISNVLLEFYYIRNHHNTRELPHYFPFPSTERICYEVSRKKK